MANQRNPYGAFPKMPYKPGTGTTKTMPYTPGTGGTAKTMPYRPKKASSPWMEKPKQMNVRDDIESAIGDFNRQRMDVFGPGVITEADFMRKRKR